MTSTPRAHLVVAACVATFVAAAGCSAVPVASTPRPTSTAPSTAPSTDAARCSQLTAAATAVTPPQGLLPKALWGGEAKAAGSTVASSTTTAITVASGHGTRMLLQLPEASTMPSSPVKKVLSRYEPAAPAGGKAARRSSRSQSAGPSKSAPAQAARP
jgi:hypothetical protein